MKIAFLVLLSFTTISAFAETLGVGHTTAGAVSSAQKSEMQNHFEGCMMIVRRTDAHGNTDSSHTPLRLVESGSGGRIYTAEIGKNRILLAHNSGRVIDLGKRDLQYQFREEHNEKDWERIQRGNNEVAIEFAKNKARRIQEYRNQMRNASPEFREYLQKQIAETEDQVPLLLDYKPAPPELRKHDQLYILQFLLDRGDGPGETFVNEESLKDGLWKRESLASERKLYETLTESGAPIFQMQDAPGMQFFDGKIDPNLKNATSLLVACGAQG